ncbi:MAG: pyruvate carboxylase, partial [Thermodesulfobacteriota bacterium]
MKKTKKRRIRPFQKILIANRGEISIRIQRACAELGITSVAIYSHEDYLSLHRVKADEAYQVGANKGPVEAYLDIEGIIEVAIANGIDAIHPGYGFLSENYHFAEACNREGIKFIGPSVESIKMMGDKAEARTIAKKVEVPVIPGTENFIESFEEAKRVAKEIGYPILIKSAFGGGGRGVRVCHEEKSIEENFNEAKSEAGTAFGNDSLLIEKFVVDPKHIEVQILADQYGKITHLFERDCSVQRRYQKVIEIAPSLTVSNKTRKKLYDCAIKIAKGCSYSNAGTVEFLVEENENFYFIEMNPRIQVEHTVTEIVTGVDLVKAQIRIAEGYGLKDEEVGLPGKLSLNGYALQCRITTEDPKNNFTPDIGTINDYRSPGGSGVRLDAASAFVGGAITPYYDSMLVKLTTYANSFEETISKMNRALNEFRIRGVKTNIPFLLNVINHPVFISGQCRTTFLEKNKEIFNIEENPENISKIIRFIGDVIVNRKIEKPRKWHEFAPATPKPPQPDTTSVPVPRHRKVFNQNGPDGLVKWVLKQRKPLVTDTTFRDAHQSLLATRMRTFDMAKVASETSILGKDIFSYEMWGGATFDVCMRFLHEDPWERLLVLRKHMPHSMFQMLLRGSNAVGYTNYPDNVVVEFIKKAATHGIDIFRIFDCFNWIPNMRVSIETVLETGKVCEAAICYSGDITDPEKEKYSLDYYLKLANDLKELGVHIIAIKDMAGLCKPYAAEKLISAVKKETGLPIHFHTHATSGNGEATILKAVEAGVDIV